MDDVKHRSLGELEQLYGEKVRHWQQQRQEHLQRAEECAGQIALYEQKLRHVQALVEGVTAPAPRATEAPGRRGRPRGRKSPIRDAALQVMRNRPGQRLTASQIRTLIRKDTHRRGTRQAVNVNLNKLMDAGLVKRAKAPKGSGGAQYVYWAE